MKNEAEFDALRVKRLEAMHGCWEVLSNRFADFKTNLTFSGRLAAEAVELYIEDYKALVGRYRIEDRIQRNKIAGLMTAAIIRKRPLVLNDLNADGANVSKHNEIFALWHAVSICSEGVHIEILREVRNKPTWNQWFSDMVYHLMTRPTDGESLSMVFGTLSLLSFGNHSQSE